jgi:hypothetical protein
MKTRRILGMVLVVVVQVWCCSALADPVPAISLGAGDVLQMNTQGGLSVGWEFTLNSPVYVTDLGVFDDLIMGSGYPAGFSSDYQIGIYRTSDGVGVAYAEIAAPGTGTGYTYNAPYRYVPLASPVALAAFDNSDPENPVQLHYVVACWTPDTSTDYQILSLNDPNNMTSNAAVNPIPHLVLGEYHVGLWSPSTALVRPTGANRNDLFAPSFRFTLEPPEPPVTEIQIDIKPGSSQNRIYLPYNWFVPVAILSSETFDPATVDPTAIDLAGAGVAVWGCGDVLMAVLWDINCDDVDDLLFIVMTADIDLDQITEDGYAILTAETYDGEALEGRDHVTIIQ